HRHDRARGAQRCAVRARIRRGLRAWPPASCAPLRRGRVAACGGSRRGVRPARRVLRRRPPCARWPRGQCRGHAVPAPGVDRAARDPTRRDHLLPDPRATDRRARRGARGGRRQRREPRRYRRALPPRDRRRRAPRRLRRRRRAQALAAGARAWGHPRAEESPMTTTPRDRARAFRALHHGGRILVLPNAWDAASARIFELVGAPAVATTSSGLAASLGYPDGERIPCELVIGAVRRITATVDIPLSVDFERGYAESPAQVA